MTFTGGLLTTSVCIACPRAEAAQGRQEVAMLSTIFTHAHLQAEHPALLYTWYAAGKPHRHS